MLRKGIIYIIILCVTFSSAFIIGYRVNQDNLVLDVIASDQIAIVNNDQVEQVNDQSYLFGDFFIDYLNNYSDDYDYVVTNSNDAKQGLINGKYGAEIVIPSNFTNSLLSYNDTKPVTAEVRYVVNSDLSENKYLELDHHISGTLDGFKTDLSYMYTYAIFDDLHFTQQNLNVIETNLEPILTFTDEVKSTDISDEYTLDLLDPEMQATLEDVDSSEINETLTNVQTQIDQSISATKTNVNNTLLAFSDDINLFTASGDEYKDGLSSSDASLAALVTDVQDYELPKLSEFDYTDKFTQIITNDLGNTVDYQELATSLNPLLEDSNNLKNAASTFNDDQIFTDFIGLVGARSNYYQSTKNIESCLAANVGDSEAQSCVNKYIGSYNSAYNSYNNYLQDLVDEASYHDQLSTYLTNFTGETSGRDNSESESTSETTDEEQTVMSTNVEKTKDKDDSTKIEKPEVEQVSKLTIDNVEIKTNENGLAMKDNALIDFDLACPETCNINIGVNDQVNIANYDLKLISGQNVGINAGANDIAISNLTTAHYQFMLNIERTEQATSSLSLLIDNQAHPITFKAAENEIEIEPNYSEEQITYTITNNSTTDLETLAITSSLYEQLTIKSVTTATNDQEYTLDGNSLEFTLAEPLVSGNSLEVVVNYSDFNNQALTVQDQLTVNDNSVATYLLLNELTVSSSMAIENSEQMSLENEQKLKLTYDITTENAYNLSALAFNLESSPANITINPDGIIMNLNGTEISTSATEDGGTVNLSLNSEQTLSGSNTIEITVPFTLSSDNLVEEDIITSSLKYLSSGEEQLPLNTSNQETVTLKHANLKKPKVNYVVDSSVCNNSIVNVKNCSFEAGDEISREIILENNNELAISNIEIKDDILSSDYFITSPDDADYTITSLNEQTAPEQLYQFETSESGNDLVYNLSIPANTQVKITQKLIVADNVVEETSFDNIITIDNQGSDQDIFTATSTLNLVPVQLAFTNLDVQDDNGDGIISPNENAIVTLEITNNAMRATINKQIIDLELDDLIDEVTVISVSDSSASNIRYNFSGNRLTINKKLVAGQSRQVKFNISFKDFTATSTLNGKVTFNLRKASDAKIDDDEVWNFTTDTLNYRQLALDLLQNESIHTNDNTNYQTAVESGNGLLASYNDFVNNFGQIDYIQTVVDQANNLAATVLDLDTANNLLGQIHSSGLATSETEEVSLANYPACQGSGQVACQMINLYNQIEVNMGVNNLVVKKGTKDFETSTEEASEQVTSITEQISGDTAALEEDFAAIKANEKPDDIDLSNVESAVVDVATSLNDTAQTQKDNFQTYEQQQAEYFTQNEQQISEYVNELTNDDTYQQMANDFLVDETARQTVNSQIIDSTQEILPNSTTNGMANTDLYSFLVAPYDYSNEEFTDLDTDTGAITKASENNKATILKMVIAVLGLIIVVAMAIYVIKYRDKE